jgi:peptidoglycan/xylan/chitin deacetylase (PgdA/CDA1 family)
VLGGLLAVLALAPSISHNRRSASAAAARVGARLSPTHHPSDPPHDENAAVNAVLAYTPFVKEGGTRGRDIALTFDDGPGPYTPEVLSVLERFHVHATFFAIGKMLRYFSASTVREIKDGDVIGDHTETHPEMATLSAHDQHEELFEQIARIELLGGRRPVLFRPPYGSFNATTMRELRSLHLLMVLWSVDASDYLQPGVPVIVQRALAGAHPGAIILLHDAGGDRTQTVAALPTIIRDLRARGFRLVTVPQLLKDDPPPAGQPLPPNLSGD